MAFMCPIRIGRSRNKKERQEKLSTPTIGRITGSASIETLVRVGLEKEQGLSANSKVVVLHDFNPCVDDELGVKRGEIVHTLYQENDWMYVISEDGSKEGFIPQSYCAAVGSHLADMALNFTRKKPRERAAEDRHQSSLESSIAHSDAESVGTPSCCTEVHPFLKDPAGRYLVLYTFVARDENDLSVERGELVTVFNREDPDWFWVLRSDGQEGFVPSAFVYPADMIESHAQSPDASEAHSSTTRQEATSQAPTSTKKHQQPEPLESQKEYRYDTKSGTISQNTYHNSSVVNAYSAARVEVNNNNSDVAAPSSSQSKSGGSGGGSSQNTLKNDAGSRKATEDQPNNAYRAKGTELVMLYDYKGEAEDDLDVERGEWVYADLNRQTVDLWLWAYSPRQSKYGFIPKAYARPPAMTSL